MKKAIPFYFITFFSSAYGTLAGGRPNAISEGQNAFAGIVNPANAVWIKDRVDVGAFWFHQKSSLNNHDNNPLFLPGKMDFTYRTKNIFTADAAIHKQGKIKKMDCSLGLATYTTPSFLKLRTKKPIPIAGSTPVFISDRIQVASLIFSFKFHAHQSIGCAIDYFYFSHCRRGFQNSDNALRSVSPGHVTNQGVDHSNGIGLTVGWRWNISKSLSFGATWTKKSECGHYRKYRGYEPHHAKNEVPQTFGLGFSYRMNAKFAGRIELFWANLGALPGANNNILPDGSLNLNKRGSKKSPGPGLQNSTYLNIGVGYKLNSMLSIGVGFSHRIKRARNSPFIISHNYMLQAIYDVLSLGMEIKYRKQELFLGLSYGFKNHVSGRMPKEIGGGSFTSEKQLVSLSASWGYRY